MKYTMQDFINKKIAVKLSNKKEVKKFLEICDNEGLKWCDGNKATGFYPDNRFKIALGFMSKNRLGFSPFFDTTYESNGWKVIDFKDIAKETQSIHIYTDGKITTAILKDGKEVIKKAQSKCHEQDEFDFKTGAKLAFDRLFGEEKKYFNGKVVCIKSSNYFTKGKVYEFKDGFTIDDEGDERPITGEPIIDYDHFNNSWKDRFIELVD